MNEIVKIVRMNEKSNDEITQSLLYCIELIGFDPKKSTFESLQFIVNYIRNNFKSIDFNELKEGFEHGVKGELDINLQHYQSFNAMYVANVIQAYRRFKAKKSATPQKLKELPLPKEEQEVHFNFIKMYFEKTKEPPMLANWNEAFAYAEKHKIIQIPIARKHLIKAEVIDELQRERQRLKVQRLNFNDVDATLNSDSLIAYECRKKILIEYFKNNINLK